MLKALAGAVVVGVAAAILFAWVSSQHHAAQDRLNQQIGAMNSELAQLRDENTHLKGDLAKVQTEQQSLAAQNEELRQAIAAVKATGKLPRNLPYPPK
jgi:septal ring factor EnvC (AmiA/AmiB activator)